MGTGAETQEETKGGASQSRDVIPELLLLMYPRTDRLQLKGDRYTYRRGASFLSNYKSDIWHIKYLIIQDQLQRWYMVHRTKSVNRNDRPVSGDTVDEARSKGVCNECIKRCD